MNIINVDGLKSKRFSPHGGKGKIDMKFAFTKLKKKGKKSNWNFFGIAEFPIGTTAGYHKHEGTDEWFYILAGEADVIIDGKRQRIKKGDIILTKDGGSHDIVNVKKKLTFIAIEVETG